MGQIHKWTFVLCLAVLICSIFEMTSPNGKMQNVLRFVLGIFLLCAIIVPISDVNFKNTYFKKINLQKTNQQETELKQEVENQTLNLAKKRLKDLAANTLLQENIEAEEIEIFMDIKEEGSISIKKIRVILEKRSEEKINKAKGVLKKELGIEDIEVSLKLD
ncbi:MAG: stage III sporulation protein AF [Oscillospiraceae bacterium]|jgi:Na+-transporting NADH:ubiquinone oxidoreductase subunit NqrC|nr:stage III sporulation protein AF [Oscillospiraceae bacterium]